ncbi:MAG: tRNA (adenosine(37)-N6)-dimethylallyltransferase MiaA [Candidatus Pacebacteria bacterium]|nr:tRNA (adenosine(37)-N6)-dimethylallyltransferase MiaA [Candidatus Paceibacterota bacterium]
MTQSTSKSLPKLIVVLGPTAVGKSDMAVEIALAIAEVSKNKKVDGLASQSSKIAKSQIVKAEIISADSRQIYTGLNIGAGKITKKEMRGIPHHCLDIVSPKRSKQFSVAEFQQHANKAIAEIIERGNIPILCGGTGFYINAIVDGIVLPEVKTNLALRKRLETYATKKLINILSKLDQHRLNEIDKNNRVRLIRSIEIADELGSVPKLIKQKKFDTLLIGLDIEKEKLMDKVHTRAIKRLKQGMVAEAKNLHASGVSWKRMKQLGLEYGLLADFLQSKITRAEFVERLLIETWQYAKRQRTWFYKKEGVQWFDPTSPADIKKILKLSLDFVQN